MTSKGLKKTGQIYSLNDSTRFKMLGRFLCASGQPVRAFVFAAASLFMATLITIANGFLFSLAHESNDAYPELVLVGFGGNSLLFTLLAFISLYIGFCGIEYFSQQHRFEKRHAIRSSPFFSSAFKLFAVIAVAWLPIIVILYPGIIYHDTEFQLVQFFGSANLDVYSGAPSADVPKITDHHPVATTLLFGFFTWVGGFLGGGYNGLFLLASLQAFLLAVSLSQSVRYAHVKLHLGPAACMAILAFYALFPLFPIYALSISKDTIFTPFFVFFSLLFAEIIRTRGQSLKDKKQFVLFVTISLCMVLTKKLGIYFLLICMLAAFAYCREGRARIAISTLASICMIFAVVPGILFPLMQAGPGSSKEMFSVPFEQTALYVKTYPDEVTDREKDVIDRVLVYEGLGDRYSPHTADFVKGTANGVEGELVQYAAVYLSQGLRHPGAYLRAFLSLESGFMGTSDRIEPLYFSVAIEGLTTDGLPSIYFKPSLLEQATLLFQDAVLWLSSAPIIGLIFSKGPYAFVLPIIAIVVLALHSKKSLLGVLPYLVFSALLYLSPISTEYNSGRYVLPLVATAPILVAFVMNSLRQNRQIAK